CLVLTRVLHSFPTRRSSDLVFLSTILFSKKERYRVPKQMVLATLATGIGLVVGASKSTGSNLIGSSLFSASFFIGLGLAANSLQMGLLFFLDKFWQTKRFSMAVMPPAFFSYNAVIGYLYITSPSPELRSEERRVGKECRMWS